MIYYINNETINNKEALSQIYKNKEENYYWSDDFSPGFYVNLAKAGFISTTTYETKENIVLLPEIQFEYAILDFNDLHISKKVKKLLKENNYKFCIDKNFEKVLENIQNYHKESWLEEQYKKMLLSIHSKNDPTFKLISVELYDNENEKLIAGEIGYIINNIYTSLTGFTTKEKKYNNYGKLQLTLLSKYLQNNNFSFWNLGHASLQYKLDLGAKIYKRDKFLERWIG